MDSVAVAVVVVAVASHHAVDIVEDMLLVDVDTLHTKV